MQLAQGFGKLMKQGWRPRRTIVLCSWDAEEFGLVCTIPLLLKHAMFMLCVAYTLLKRYATGRFSSYMIE